MRSPGFWARVITGVVASAGAAAWPVSNMTFEEAVAKSKAEGGWLLVAPFSPECSFCEMKLTETLASTTMRRRLDEGWTVIRVNIRADFEAARALHVGQMPAYIVFKDGVEFDRIAGRILHEPDVEDWLSGVMAGKSRHAGLLEEAKSRGEVRVDVMRRQRLAEELVEAGEYALAREEYIWLWRNMLKHAVAQAGVRTSFMAGRMQSLATLDLDSRDAFRALRDEAGEALRRDDGSWDTLVDWLALNDVVGEPSQTLTWFDRVKDSPEGRATIARVGFRLDDLLKKRRRWADLVLLYPDPLEAIRRQKALRDSMPGNVAPFGDGSGEHTNSEAKYFRESCADLYAAYLCAGLDQDGAKIAELARELDASPHMITSLVRRAVDIGQPREAHLAMLEEAGAAGEAVEALTRRVREGLPLKE